MERKKRQTRKQRREETVVAVQGGGVEEFKAEDEEDQVRPADDTCRERLVGSLPSLSSIEREEDMDLRRAMEESRREYLDKQREEERREAAIAAEAQRVAALRQRLAIPLARLRLWHQNGPTERDRVFLEHILQFLAFRWRDSPTPAPLLPAQHAPMFPIFLEHLSQSLLYRPLIETYRDEEHRASDVGRK